MTTACKCLQCGWRGATTDLACQLPDVPDWIDRVNPGDQVPIGQCSCGGLANLVQTADGYSYDEVMAIIREKLGRHNGGLMAWVRYSESLYAAGSHNRYRVTPAAVQVWRRVNHYPVWAVQQLIAMPIVTRTCHRWSDDDVEFLRVLRSEYPDYSELQLARRCSTEFGCAINTNSIKSKLHSLRNQNRLPRRLAPPEPLQART